MTLHRRTLFGATAGCALASLSPREASAQTRWQMATAYPDANFHTRNNRQFLDEVRAAIGVETQMHTNASLLPQAQIKRGVQQGQVQLGEILLSAYGNEDVFFEVDSIPAGSHASDGRLIFYTDTAQGGAARDTTRRDPFARMQPMARPPFGAITLPVDPAPVMRLDSRSCR